MKTSFWQRWRAGDGAIRRGLTSPIREPRLEVQRLEDRTLPSVTAQMLKDIYPGAEGSSPAQFVAVGSEAYFYANDGTGNEMWKTDGTPDGTVMVADIDAFELRNVNGELFFVGLDNSTPADYTLRKSDGTAAGTTLVKDFGSNFPEFLTNINGTLLFSDNNELWKSDGTTTGTTMVAGIAPTFEYYSDCTNINGELFFVVSNSTAHDQLWESNGTAAGTTMVKDFNGGGVSQLTDVNGTLYFAANDGTHGDELWKSTGTAAGTTMVADTTPTGFNVFNLTNVNGELFFSVSVSNTANNGYQLWKSNGTAAGTTIVKDFNTGIPGTMEPTNVNGALYFDANDGKDAGYEVWKSDGTTAGTTIIKDINPGTLTTYTYGGYYGTYTITRTSYGCNPNDLTNVNGTLYFSANDGTHGDQLWESDGTAAGTTMLTDINPGDPLWVTNFNGTLLFAADDGIHGLEPWVLPTATPSAPSVSGISPNLGPTSGGTTVTISGSNLGYATEIEFGSTAVTNFISNTAGEIVVNSPAGVVGTVNVTVVTAGGASAILPADEFTYQPMSTITSLNQAKGPSVYGQAVTFTSTVTETISNGEVPTGTVTFLDGSVAVGTGQLNAHGVATFCTLSLAVGTQSISASYSGDSANAPSTSTSLMQTVEQASTAAVLITSSNPTLYGEQVIFIASISPIPPGAGNPTGSVTFYDSNSPLQTALLQDGIAIFTTTSLAVGVHSITAVYSGDSNFQASTSSAVNQVVYTTPTVASVVINPGEGSPGSKTYLGNSRILSIQVTFSEAVNTTALKSAFKLTRVGLPNGAAGDNAIIGSIFIATSTNSSGATVALLTFSGGNTEGGSLADGDWSLSIASADVTSNGVSMAANYNTPSGSGILRLFGDYDGTGNVDSSDLGVLGTTFGLVANNPGFLTAFDNDGNGVIDSTDLGRFGTNFGLSI